MTKFYLTLILILFFIKGLNAQEKHVFSAKSKTAFKKIATPESTLRWMTVKETEKVPKAEFLQKSKVIFDLDEKTTFKEIRSNEGVNDWLHHRLQQTYNGIPILGAEYLLHEKNGLVETANGEVVTGLDINTMPSISEEVALQMLLNEIGAEKYAWENNFSEKMLKYQKEDENATYFPEGELIIASTNEDFNPENFTLAYKFRIKTIQPFSHADYIVDAFTGSVIYENSLLCQATGTCQTHRYGTQAITTKYSNNIYSLVDEIRNIETYDGLGRDSDNVGAVYYYDSDNNWTNANQKSACEAHWVLGKTYDYFLNEHNWQGHDNYGSKLIAWANVGNNWNNAQGGGGEVYLGEGDGINYGPFTAIDIVAHEFTHSVIQTNANLYYSRESGALNESFADIFGTLVEFYAEPDANEKDWLLGEDVSLSGIEGVFRDMSNPASKGDPATYQDDNWGDVNSCGYNDDNCHVHSNSGVQNHWFYILSNGKAGTNYFGYTYDIAGIGMTKAAKVAMENLKNYLSPFSDYKDARNGAIQAATALNLSTDEINQVKEAWCAVGLGDCDITTTGQITVTSPNGGESLNQGIAKNIIWNRTGNTGTEVKIEYSINAGNEWHIITEATTNDGTYQWLPPSVATNLALIRVSSNADETIYDASNDYFSINSCAVKASFDASDQYPCANETVTFTTTSTGGANTYKWYINGLLSYTGPIFNYNFSQAGNYEVELRAIIGNTCGDVETFNVFVKPSVNADFTYNGISQTINFSAPNNAFDATYLWTTGDGEDYDTRTISKVYESAGTYTICLTVNSSCGSDSVCKNVQANVLGCLDPTACNYDANANLDLENCIYGNCNNCLESDSLALVALYNATDGPNWTSHKRWNLLEPVNTWHGIITSGCHVTRIYLPVSNLSGELPIEIGNLQSLHHLELRYNNLSGEIPIEIGNLQSLSHLDLGTNNLSDEIPVEIGNLQNLIYLKLSGNSLFGEIPVEISNLQNLSKLSLDNNSLSGEILVEICNLQNLIDLNLSYNSLSGEIPAEIGNLQNLNRLYLISNNLLGEIPIEICNLTNLGWLTIDNNNLSGKLPEEISNLQNLIYLSLSNNNFSGEVPKEIGSLQNLQNLILFRNNLSGEIPKEIGNLQNLDMLHLSTNNLSGEIPSEVGNLQNLIHFYLFDNNLSGCYPSSLCNLSIDFSNSNNYFNCTENLGLPDNGSDQGFQDFCNGISPCNSDVTEVYPGDLNFDGITNHKDILSFGLYNGEYGIERDEAYQNINWSAHPSTDWGVAQENSAELKHTDADGNGVVDLKDVQAIETNYGNTHNASPIITPPNTNPNDSPIEITLVANALPSFVGNDNELVLDILMEDVLGSELALYGSYFSINYDDPDLVINNIEVEFNQSWFGTPNLDFEYIVHKDDANKQIDIGITKVDHQNSIGEGVVGKILASVDNDTPWDTLVLNFLVNDIVMQNSESFALPVGSALATVVVTNPDCLPALNIISSTPLSNHIAEGLIQTTGNISINDSQDITFGSDRLKVNDGLTVEDGGEFAYYNAPCGTSNRSANSGQDKFIKPNQLFKSGSYKIIKNDLVFDLDLIKEGKVSFEILGNSNNEVFNNTHLFEFGERTKGSQQVRIPLGDLPADKFYACLKVGADRYYFEVGL